nr:uncharacterized protein LOC111836698 [Paramormyrops kingsleyae]
MTRQPSAPRGTAGLAHAKPRPPLAKPHPSPGPAHADPRELRWLRCQAAAWENSNAKGWRNLGGGLNAIKRDARMVLLQCLRRAGARPSGLGCQAGVPGSSPVQLDPGLSQRNTNPHKKGTLKPHTESVQNKHLGDLESRGQVGVAARTRASRKESARLRAIVSWQRESLKPVSCLRVAGDSGANPGTISRKVGNTLRRDANPSQGEKIKDFAEKFVIMLHVIMPSNLLKKISYVARVRLCLD